MYFQKAKARKRAVEDFEETPTFYAVNALLSFTVLPLSRLTTYIENQYGPISSTRNMKASNPIFHRRNPVSQLSYRTLFTLALITSSNFISSPFHFVNAVDHSKFRTCDQTSFCRRHRDSPPHHSRQFKVDASSIKFSFPGTKDNEKDSESTEGSRNKEGGIWNTLFGSLSPSSAPHREYLGPPPLLTALLNSNDSREQLQMNIHLHDDGVARLRITETDQFIQSLENIQEKKHRWTSDELVLKEETMKSVKDGVEFIPNGNAESNFKLKSYIHRLNSGEPTDTNEYMALKYNNNSILIRLDSFEFHLFEDSKEAIENNDPPTVSINADNLMYFEQRRSHKHQPASNVNGNPKQFENEGVERLAKEKNENEKEIVGYWEDGKAIYADGSREDDDNENDEEDEEMDEDEEEDEEGLWEEKFQSHKDSKPYGPMSVGLDISFPKSNHLYGIPEHASQMRLQTTIGIASHYEEPYRLYNLDVFEYELDETMALYGSIPFLVSHRVAQMNQRSSSVGVFWFNPTETFIDVFSTSKISGTGTHWMSESGIIDIFLLPGLTQPSRIYEQYASLTGYPYLPPSFALGYHQCRWNYRDENDALTVHANFEKYDYPYDVLWLDIEHTDGKRYFTWDKSLFPNPEQMQEKIASQGRKMVTIVDPHIKRDSSYYVHNEATSKKLYIKDKDGKDFDGWCWPGSSSYPDFTSSKVREWWATQFFYKNYKGSTPSLYTWNDMNEPSVFNGPEVSMQKDNLNLENIEHREWHNLYGMTFHRATAEGLVLRNIDDTPTRPFVLSRSFFAGSQQYGPM